jgi:hypothetical protein
MTTRPMCTMLRSRLPQRGDDQGSMAMAILAVVVGMLLGALILPMLIIQDRASKFDVTRVHSLDAAQTGIDTVLGQVRAATRTDRNGNVWGDAGTLPCGPISGSANGVTGGGGAASTGTYSVSIDYYATDPTQPGATKMLCAAGYGPYDSARGTRTPRFARITSTGTDGPAGNGGSAGRTLVTTYVFETDDANIPGGVIRLYPDSTGGKWCMDAGSATPTSGTAVVLRACSSAIPANAQQVFAYRNDLSIQLVSSVTDSNPAGMCLDTATTPHAIGVGIVLNTCAIADTSRCTDITACSPWNQQWSVDDNAHIEGAKSDRSVPTQAFKDGYCIDAASQGDAIPLTLQTCVGSTQDPRQTWVPSPTTGAGMAGATYGQEVNYGQFGNCLDVTGQNPDSTFLILYTCKQDPNPTQVTWNQVFTPSPTLGTAPTDVLLKTTYNKGSLYPTPTTFCLLSPGTEGGYVRIVTSCPATPTGLYDWTVYTVQDQYGNDLPYKQKYQIVDSTGRCLAPGPNNDLYIGTYLKVVTVQCDGSTGQKWNANPSLDAARLTNTQEK